VGGQSWSLDGGQNRFSFGTVDTSTRSGVKIMGISLHDLDGESCGGVHRVAPKAVSEVKAQAEAMFHMY
jgi:hypothetical protein